MLKVVKANSWISSEAGLHFFLEICGQIFMDVPFIVYIQRVLRVMNALGV